MLESLSNSACALFENDSQIRVRGKKIWVASSKKNRSHFGKVWINLWRLVFIQFVKLRYRPAVTISHLEGPNFANLLTFGGGERIVFVHNAISDSYRQRSLINLAKRFLARRLYRHAAKVVGVSPFIRDELETVQRIDKSKLLFLSNPINIAKIREAAREKYTKCLHKLMLLDYIICVGSLTIQKNHRLAITIFDALLRQRQSRPSLKLVILGEGPMRNELIEFSSLLGLEVASLDLLEGAEQLNLSADVFFAGFQANPYRFMRHAKAFLMTSEWEGLPISVLESLALEVPVVVSDCSSSIGLVMQAVKGADKTQTPGGKGSLHTECGWIIFNQGESPEEVEIWRAALEGVVRGESESPNAGRRRLEVAKKFDISKIRKLWDSSLLGTSAR
jgi:glycosyltransferase involved in cell wall biosynthesis